MAQNAPSLPHVAAFHVHHGGQQRGAGIGLAVLPAVQPAGDSEACVCSVFATNGHHQPLACLERPRHAFHVIETLGEFARPVHCAEKAHPLVLGSACPFL